MTKKGKKTHYRMISVSKFQRNIYQALKQMPLVVTSYGKVKFYVVEKIGFK